MQLLAYFIKFVVITLALPTTLVAADDRKCIWENPTKYNESCSKQALLYSFSAYTTDLNLLYRWQCQYCNESLPLHIVGLLEAKPGENRGYIAYQISSPNVLIVSFRGTTFSDLDSVIADLDFNKNDRWPEHVDNSHVHHGFITYYSKLQQKVRNIVTGWSLKFSDMKLVITGHSLGGALAIMAAVDLFDLVPNPIVYTFGCPRVGNGFFAQHVKDLNLSIFRVNHDHDVVAQIPFCLSTLFGRPCEGEMHPTHVPTEILYNKNMTSYIECSRDNGEDPICSNSFKKLSLTARDHQTYFGYKIA